MSYFPLIEIFTACLEYNFVIYSLNIFKFDMIVKNYGVHLHKYHNFLVLISSYTPIWPSFS